MREITLATLADIPQLCELLAILFTQEADFQPDAGKQATALRQIIEHPELGRILVLRGPVLRNHGEILGMVSLLFTVSTACGGKVALLEDMVMHPAHRNGGLGGRLLQAAKDLARRENCLRVTLLTDRSNAAAIRFYRRSGFEESAMIPLRLSALQSRD